MPSARRIAFASTGNTPSSEVMASGMDEMTSERKFRDKWQRRIDGCGPYCSCLVIIIVLAFAVFAWVLR
jgi:hypothetical protein